MAGAGEFLGGVAGAAPGLLKLPIDVSDNVLQWEKFKAGLHEGGVVNAFPPRTNLLDGLEQRIAEGVLTKTGVPDCDVAVELVTEKGGKRIIGFRSPRSKAKMALRLEWDYVYATIRVTAKKELVHELADGSTKVVKANDVVRDVPRYGGFVNNIRVYVHNTTHIHGRKYAFAVGGSVESKIKSAPGDAVQEVTVGFSLAPHITKSTFQGSQEETERSLGKDPQQFRYTITGKKQVTYHDTEGNTLAVPGDAPAAGEHFLAAELVALHESSAMQNQGVLWSLNKGKGKTVDVVALSAAELKVRTDGAPEVPAPAEVKNLKLFLVIGTHTDNLSDYLKRYPTCKTGKLRYSSVRGHGTWRFQDGNLKDLEPLIRAEVKRQFEVGGDRTKKHISFP